jgi:hypothetical protein
MDYENMSKEGLIEKLRAQDEYLSNIIVFWGDKREYKKIFEEVARNETGEYTEEESRSAQILANNQSAFEEFVELTQASFERGGISHILSEKVSALMEEAASRHSTDS